MKTLIEHGTVVNRSGRECANVLLDGDTIAYVGSDRPTADRVIDAAGCYIMPGFIDTHTHLELSPNLFVRDTQAAAIGGTTCVLEFANQFRGTTMRSAYDTWMDMAKGSTTNFSFHMSLSQWNEAQEPQLAEMSRLGISSYKMYMVYDNLKVNDGEIYRALQAITAHGGILGVHCENWDVLLQMIEEVRASGKLDPTGHPLSRPAPVEAEAVSRFLRLAQLAGAPAYIVHLSCLESLEEVRRARARGQEVYVETCPHYLVLDERKYAEEDGCKYMMSPPLRKESDCAALWQAVVDGEIDTIGTDHCSFTMEQKRVSPMDFSQVPNGCAGLEHRPQLIYTYGVASGKLTLEQMVALLSANAAELFGLSDRGAIHAGKHADLVVWDPSFRGTITDTNHHHDCDNSIYAGLSVEGRARDVFINGAHVVENGALTQSGGGQFVHRAASGRFRRKG